MGKTFWKYLGAMMSEKKDGETAASFTRVLAVLLFVALSGLWVANAAGTIPNPPPSEAVYTLWALIGIKGAKDTATALRKS